MAVETQANEPGFVLVPREPTDAMLLAAFHAAVDDLQSGVGNMECQSDEERSAKAIRPIYRAMLAAASAAPLVPSPAYGGVRALHEAVLQAIRSWGDGPCDSLEDLERRVLSCLSPVAVEEADAKAGWRDMMSAPKDGTVIWLFQPHEMGGFMFAGAVNADGVWINNLDLKVQNPTHWMPLPSTPSRQIGKAGAGPVKCPQCDFGIGGHEPACVSSERAGAGPVGEVERARSDPEFWKGRFQVETAARIAAEAALAETRERLEKVEAALRKRIAAQLDEEAGNTPDAEDAKVVRDCANLVRHDFSYEAVDVALTGDAQEGAK